MELCGAKKIKLDGGDKSEGYFIRSFVMKRLALLLFVGAAVFVFAGLTAQHRVNAAEGQIHEADDLLARKQRTIDWKNKLLSDKTKALHSRDSEIEERDRILGAKQRTLEYKEELIREKTKLIHKSDEEKAEQLKVLGRQERTIEWKNEVIRDKSKQLEQKEEELAARSDMLARKARTLEWKQELIREKVKQAAERQQEMQHIKKQLFETQHIHHLSENQMHAKLIKVLATLQSHLTRHQRHEHVVQASKEHMKQAVGKHAQAMKKLIDALPAKKSAELKEATSQLHSTIHEIIAFVSEQIVEENDSAEARLKKVTQDVLDELQTDIADEKKLTELEEHEAAADMEYKQMLEEAHKNDSPSKDEESVTKMIKEYKKTVDSIRSPTGMKQSDVDKGYKIVDSIRDGTLDFEEGQRKMKAQMTAHSYPIDETATDLIAIFEQFLSEGEFMVQHEATRKKLKQWESGTLSNSEMVMEIEKVSPGMLESLST